MIPYYEQDGITIYHGDALQVMTELPARSVDVVTTDPPYFLPAAHYNVRSGTSRSLGDLSILEHFFRSVFAGVRRVLTDAGFAYVFCDGQSYPPFYVTAYPHFRKLRPIVWDKQTSINGYAWRHQHELILFCESEQSPHVKTGDGDVLRHRAVPINDRQHLAQKPVDLLSRLIAKVAPPGGIILDPFVGSGATLEAAKILGCRAIGVDTEERNCEIAATRLSQSVLPLEVLA